MTWVEQAVVLEELGRAAAWAVPRHGHTIRAGVLEAGSAEQRKRWIGRDRRRADRLARRRRGRRTWAAGDIEATAIRDGDGFRLSGRKRFVLDAATADEIVVAARLDGELVLLVVPGDDLAVDELMPIDATTRHGDIELDGLRVEGERLLAGGGESALDAIEEAATAVTVSTVGTCQRIFDLVLAYAKEREQFGVPVGSFQAVKHKLVDMYRDLERAATLGYFAALCIAEGVHLRSLAWRWPRRRPASVSSASSRTGSSSSAASATRGSTTCTCTCGERRWASCTRFGPRASPPCRRLYLDATRAKAVAVRGSGWEGDLDEMRSSRTL